MARTASGSWSNRLHRTRANRTGPRRVLPAQFRRPLRRGCSVHPRVEADFSTPALLVLERRHWLPAAAAPFALHSDLAAMRIADSVASSSATSSSRVYASE